MTGTALLDPVTTCEVCGRDQLMPLFDLGLQPLCDDLLPIGSQADCARYPVELLGCANCITVHQKYQVPKPILFPDNYHYRAALTQDVILGMAEFVDLAKREAGGNLKGKLIVDIGCNDGSLLSQFRKEGAVTIGVEPTGAAIEAKQRAEIVFKRFFDRSAAEAILASHRQPDFITFTNVFAHISNLGELLAALKMLIGPTTKIIIENHYLGSVIEKAQFDTFYHEHPRTYSQRSLEVIADRLGLKVTHVDFPQRYNGNIRVVMSASGEAVASKANETSFLASLAKMPDWILAGRKRFFNTIRPYIDAHGPLPAKAFPGRAAIIVTSFGIDERVISAAYERPGSPKIGHLVPGTRIPILNEEEFFETPDAPVIVNFAWHISAEIHRYMAARGFEKPIIDVFGG